MLNLRRGAVIKPHHGAELAFERGQAHIHLPIFANPEVGFFIEDERVSMEPGTCWYINANLTHPVANRGDSDGVGAANFRNDVTVDGAIDASDISIVKSRSGTSVP